MKAMVFSRYGPPDVLGFQDVDKPVPKADEVLVKVYATTVTAGDWRMRKGAPFTARLYNGIKRPKRVNILGFELSGVIESVGAEVRRFSVGDSVCAACGFGFGGYAEYRALPEIGGTRKGLVALMPNSVPFEAAAALPLGGLAALNILRKGNIQDGQRVLIYGASGSVGTYAVQLAKYFGANVTGVCSAKNFEMVRSLGADEVIDYTREDVTLRDVRYSVVFDAVGPYVSGLKKTSFAKIVDSQGIYVNVEMSRKDRPEDLSYLIDLVESGVLHPVIDKTYPLSQAPEAHAYVEQGHKKGNVVLMVT